MAQQLRICLKKKEFHASIHDTNQKSRLLFTFLSFFPKFSILCIQNNHTTHMQNRDKCLPQPLFLGTNCPSVHVASSKTEHWSMYCPENMYMWTLRRPEVSFAPQEVKRHSSEELDHNQQILIGIDPKFSYSGNCIKLYSLATNFPSKDYQHICKPGGAWRGVEC